jgi:hypothetical protein
MRADALLGLKLAATNTLVSITIWWCRTAPRCWRRSKDGIEKLLAGDLFDDATRSHAAIALARIGDPEYLADLHRMIDADIVRHRAKPNPTTYASWFVQALLMLAAPGTDAVLTDLLREQKYEGCAARGLLQLAFPPNRDKRWLGNTTNYEAIWEARAGAPPARFDTARAKQYAQALKQRIEALKQEGSSAGNPQHYAGRIKGLAVLLAAFDGRDFTNFVIDALTLPAQWDAYTRMIGIRALLLSGATLSLDSMLSVLDPAIEHTLSQGLYNDQNFLLLVSCLELLPFSDNPECFRWAYSRACWWESFAR